MASIRPGQMSVSMLLILVMVFDLVTMARTTTGEVITSPHDLPAMTRVSDVTTGSAPLAEDVLNQTTSSRTWLHDPTLSNMSIYQTNKLSTSYINMVYADLGRLTDIDCRLRPVVQHLDEEIQQLFHLQTKLIEFTFHFVNHTHNPMLQNTTWVYKGNMWTRVVHSHGQTMLSLAFNYGVLSLMTLNFGVARMDIDLIEQPFGCLVPLNEVEKLQVMLELLLRDFNPDGEISVMDGQSVCHQMIKNANGYAKFTDQCCFKRRTTEEIVCTIDLPNQWLYLLDVLMTFTAIVVFLWGPMVIMSLFRSQTLDTVRYKVNLKEPLYKTISVFRGHRPQQIFTNHEIDLRRDKNFARTRAICQKLPENKVIPIKISEFNILVNYNRLLPENEVPVGVFQCLSKAIFLCKIREVDVFADCCESNLFGAYHDEDPYPWINVCRVIGRLLLVLAMPFPFYIRLAVFYIFEHPEVMDRTAAAAHYGLPIWFEYRILQYFTPLHPLLVTIYLIYFSVGFTVAIMSDSAHKNIFKTMIIDTLKDLSNMSLLSALQMVVSNFIWPFKKMGLFGFLFGLIYWPIIMPLCILACCFYCTPLIFACCRLVTHALQIASTEELRKDHVLPGELKLMPTGMQAMEADKLLDWVSFSDVGENRLKASIKRHGLLRLAFNFVLACVAIVTLISIMIVFTECVTFVLQICVFTMMGIIVNAGRVLKYGTLIFLVVLYSYDCYNNVYKQYIKLNRALFSEIKFRIKDIMDVTSLPSYLQENMGFKSAEASEQNEYETTDDLSKDEKKQWVINDLILFIDNDDVPRIPELLFEEVCGIRVPGSPGPVYLSLLAATGKFLFIIIFLIFVFIVVLSFGNVYHMSGTNTMLATLAGGFMPMVFRNVLKPATPDIELNSLSFKSKLEEVVINFWQVWPMYDFPFDLEEKPEEDEDAGSGSDSEDKGDKKKGKDKKDKDKKGKDKKGKKEKKGHSDSLASLGMLGDEVFVDEIQIKEKLSEMKSVRPADGQYVDIVILLPDDSEWDLDLSSSYEHESVPLKATVNNNITNANGATVHEV